MTSEEIFNNRKNKFLKIGRNKGFISNLDQLSSLKSDNQNFYNIFKSKKILLSGIGVLLVLALIFYFL